MIKNFASSNLQNACKNWFCRNRLLDMILIRNPRHSLMCQNIRVSSQRRPVWVNSVTCLWTHSDISKYMCNITMYIRSNCDIIYVTYKQNLVTVSWCRCLIHTWYHYDIWRAYVTWLGWVKKKVGKFYNKSYLFRKDIKLFYFYLEFRLLPSIYIIIQKVLRRMPKTQNYCWLPFLNPTAYQF